MKPLDFLKLGAVIVLSLLTWGIISNEMAKMKAKKAATVAK